MAAMFYHPNNPSKKSSKAFGGSQRVTPDNRALLEKLAKQGNGYFSKSAKPKEAASEKPTPPNTKSQTPPNGGSKQ